MFGLNFELCQLVYGTVLEIEVSHSAMDMSTFHGVIYIC